MSTSKNILKTYFQTGDFPTEAQFAELIDSFRHVDDGKVIRNFTINANGDLTITLNTNETIQIDQFVLPSSMPVSFIDGLQSIIDNSVTVGQLNEAIATSAYGIKYSWNSDAERNAQTGMKKDEQGVQKNTREVYKYTGSNWQLFYTLDAVHNHDDRYYTESESDARFLGKTAKAADSNRLDGLDSSQFARTSHSHPWEQITDVPATFPPSSHNHDDRYYTESESDARFLEKTGKATDSDRLDGLDSSAFARMSHSHSWNQITGKPSTFPVSSHNHDDRYYTESESDARFLGKTAKASDSDRLDGIDSSGFARQEIISAKTLSTGWYTIAVNNGDRASAKFVIRETRSSYHQAVHFYAGHHFGNGNIITVLSNSSYANGGVFRYLRIKEGSTYDGVMLQVYIDVNDSPVYGIILEDIQANGWIAKNWIPDGTNPGNVSNFSALTNVAAQVDLDKTLGINTTEGLYSKNLKVLTEGTDLLLTDQELKWEENTDGAAIGFKNSSDADTDSYLYFKTLDNGNEYFKWIHQVPQSAGGGQTEWMQLKAQGLKVLGNIYANNALVATQAWSNGAFLGKTAKATDSDRLDGLDSSAFLKTTDLKKISYEQSGRDFAHGTLIKTNIDYSRDGGDPWLLEIQGNSYGSKVPFDVKYQGYIYNGTIINHGGISNGTKINNLEVFNHGGFLCFWFPRQAYWQGFSVFVNDSNAGTKENRLVSITDEVIPSGITKRVDLSSSLNQSWHNGNDGAGSGLDADKLDGLEGAAYARASHNHNDLYYTESESNARFLGKTAKAADSDKLDGLNSTSFFRDNANNIGNWQLASKTKNSAYGYAALEIREANFGSSQTGANSEAPRISFHWGGRVASQIMLRTDGDIAIMNNPGTGYEHFRAANIYSNDALVATQSWANGAFLGKTSKATDSDRLDGLNSSQFLRGDTYNSGSFGFTDSSRYILYTASNWGLYWDTGSNIMKWRGAGSDRMLINLGNGNLEAKGSITAQGNIHANSHIYGRTVNGAYSNLYRFGGVYLTWDSDSYGTNTEHSIRSTYGNTYGDSLTMNSFNNIRLNIDSNNNNSNSKFEIGNNTTGTSNVLFSLDETGTVRAKGDVVAYSTSDMNLKSAIKPIASPLTKINQLSGNEFVWNEKQTTYEEGSKDYGIIAQEVASVLPEAVRKNEDTGHLSVRYEKLIPLLIEGMKEQQGQIEELKTKLYGTTN
ncbi:tail fiber domain-containing protein [Tenacibaculum amylolyticum]|uniref:tail fiber domain-containing protein n=1 Tax=Tenacibaculum amylolyticum TaxID=104269 RepID=UPI003893E5CE